MIVWILLFQGAILSSAWGCRLEDVCRANGIQHRTVDPFSDFEVSARCSGPDASSSSWYIRRYTNGNDSLDGLGAPLTLNDSFRQNGNELTIRNVSSFAEGTYYCGVDNNTAALCLVVRGQPVFTSCMCEYPSIENITGTANDSVPIDTRVTFNDGGFCRRTKPIRLLRVLKDQEQMYLCSNLVTFASQLCGNNDKFRVEQQQTCNGSNITLCKYDIKLVLLNFNESDKGIYEVVIEFENDGNERGTLSRQFNITLLNEPSNNNSLTTSATSFTTSSTNITTSTTTSPTLSAAAVAGIVVAGIVVAGIFAVGVGVSLICKYKKKQDPANKQDNAKEMPLQSLQTSNDDSKSLAVTTPSSPPEGVGENVGPPPDDDKTDMEDKNDYPMDPVDDPSPPLPQDSVPRPPATENSTPPPPPAAEQSKMMETNTDEGIPLTSPKNDSNSPAVTKENFPYLKCENLSTEDMNRLKTRLSVKSEDIQDKFSVLLSKTVDSLNHNKKITLEPLRRLLQNHKIPKMNKVSKTLKKAFDHCCFYSFRILKLVIDRFGTPEDKDRLAQYEEIFKQYCEGRLCEIPIDAVATGKTEEKIFYVKTDKVFTVPFKEILYTEAKLEKILNKPIYLKDVEHGCIKLCFYILHELDEIFPLKEVQMKELKGIGVLSVYDQDHQYYPMQTCDEQARKEQELEMDSGGVLSERSLGNCCYLLKQKKAADNAEQNAAEPTAFDGVGIVLKINGSSLKELLPGVKKADSFQSNLVMLTCHSVLQSIEESSLEHWRMTSLSSGVRLNEVKWHPLNTFVSGAVSCCGEQSFIGPGRYSLRQHNNDIKCDLDLNFTLLFLKAEFTPLLSEPCIEMNLPIDRRVFFKVVNTFFITPSSVSPKKAQQEASKQLQYAGEKTIPGTLSLFCRNKLGHFQLVPIHVSSLKALDVSTTGCSLEHEVSLMKKFLNIEYTIRKEDATDYIPPGSPIVYGMECNNLRVIGMHPGQLLRSDGVYCGVTIHGVFQLLQGGPVACFCLLNNPQVKMLWQDRWEHLLLPYLKNESSIDVRRFLEIFLYFTKKQLVKFNPQDLVPTRMSCLNLIGALFHQFSRFSLLEIDSMLQAIGHETEVHEGIASLCKEVMMCVQDLADINPCPDYEKLFDACSSYCCEMLDFKYRGIIKMNFKQGSLLQLLDTVQKKYTSDGSRDQILQKIKKKLQCIEEE